MEFQKEEYHSIMALIIRNSQNKYGNSRKNIQE